MSIQLQQQDLRVIYSFFGPPGSGKGTLADQLKNELGFEVLSTGNLCRYHMAQNTPMGRQIQELVDNGQLIPDSLMTTMVLDWLIERLLQKKSVILDGFPRTAGQADALIEFLKKHENYHFRVAFIELASEEILKRLLGRKVCSNKACQAVYDSTCLVDSCQQCSSLLVRRVDDKEEVIKERLRLYPFQREALLDMYRALNIHIEEFNVIGMSKIEVFSTFKATL